MDTTDRYATAKATLRENVKWLSASFAGMAAIVLAGTPFTGFGALPIDTWRFRAALGGLVVAMVCAFMAWQLLLRMVRPDATYTRFLRTGATVDLKQLSSTDQLEYKTLKDEFERHKEELLPEGKNFFDDLEGLVKEAWDDYQANPQVEVAKDRWLEYRGNLRIVEDWAAYTRLYQRVERGLKIVRWWGIGLLISLAAFAWCANPQQKDAASNPGTVVEDSFNELTPTTPPSEAPQLAPVFFDLNQFKLTPDGLLNIGRARDYLRTAPGSALLLLSHTDTTGGAQVNTKLAAERIDAVRNELIGHGGIAPTRIFVGEFPRADLSVLTRDHTPMEQNRSVEFVAFPMPVR
jgi:outer membrane protein OmpA-like peptidoglycan-associated protein